MRWPRRRSHARRSCACGCGRVFHPTAHWDGMHGPGAPVVAQPAWDPAMTLGDFRRLTADMPDDTVIVGEMEEELLFNELGEVKFLPAGPYVIGEEDEPPYVVDMPPALLLFGGQIVNFEFALDVRYDQQFLDGIE